MPKFIIRVDDVFPRMGAERFERFSSTLLEHGIPCLIGVIPDCHDESLFRSPPDADFWSTMRQLKEKGWSISQHGYTHVYDASGPDWLGLKRLSEFAGHSFETQVSRLRAGAEILEHQGLATDIFMAPGHGFDFVTVEALKVCGFTYITDGAALWPYEKNGLIFVPQLFARGFHLGFGIYTVCCHLDTMTEPAFEKLLQFIVTNKHRIISFGESVRLMRTGGPWGYARRMLEAFQYRRLRGKVAV